MNRVFLIGRLGRDPEFRVTQQGNRIAKFPLATSDSWKDKQSGERKERTDWHNIVVMNDALVTIAEKYLRRGGLVLVEGQLQTRKYPKDGIDYWITEVVCGPFKSSLVNYTRVAAEEAADAAPREPPRAGQRPRAAAQRSFHSGLKTGANGGRGDGSLGGGDLDDEVPF